MKESHIETIRHHMNNNGDKSLKSYYESCLQDSRTQGYKDLSSVHDDIEEALIDIATDAMYENFSTHNVYRLITNLAIIDNNP